MDNQFYGLTEAGEIVLLPRAEYSSAALQAYQESCKQTGQSPQVLQVLLSEHQYRVIYSHAVAEIEDHDGDGLVPHYLCIALPTELPVFPHASVDTAEELEEFRQGYPVPLSTGVPLSFIKDSWPIPEDTAESS